MGITDRFRGQVSFGTAIPSRQLANLENVMMAPPVFTNNGETTVANVYELQVQFYKSRWNNDTGDGEAETGDLVSSQVFGHYFFVRPNFQTQLSTSITGSSAGSNSIVMPDSTLNYAIGSFVSSTNGILRLRVTSTELSTAQLRVVLPSGLVVLGSTLAFT